MSPGDLELMLVMKWGRFVPLVGGNLYLFCISICCFVYHPRQLQTIANPEPLVIRWVYTQRAVQLFGIFLAVSWRILVGTIGVPRDGILKFEIIICGRPSKNRDGPPKSSILIGFSIINHPFWGFPPIFGNTHVVGIDCFTLRCMVLTHHPQLWIGEHSGFIPTMLSREVKPPSSMQTLRCRCPTRSWRHSSLALDVFECLGFQSSLYQSCWRMCSRKTHVEIGSTGTMWGAHNNTSKESNQMIKNNK